MPQVMNALNLLEAPLESINLIEASAGTGKTYTISNLYLRFILEKGLSVHEILVVTFTEAATKELRERLWTILDKAYCLLCSQELDTALTGEGHIKAILRNFCSSNKGGIEAAKKRLRLAVVSFDEAAIFTIHGFCQRMLNENAFESNLPFDLELITQDSDMLQQVVNDFWRRLVLREDLYVQTLLANGLLSLEDLSSFAKSITKKADIRLSDDSDRAVAVNGNALAEKLKECWFSNKEQIVAILKDTKNNKLTRSQDKYAIVIVDQDVLCFDRMTDNFFPAEKIRKYAQTTLNDAVTPAQKAKGVLAMSHDFFTLCDEFTGMLDDKLLEIKHEFFRYIKQEFRARKLQLNVQSFDDILHNLRQALRDDRHGSFHNLIRSRFRAVMIDEFQDTDPVQYEIFQRVFMQDGHRHTVFLIGDPKQSIYKFRGADIFAYLKAKKLVDTCWTLSTNFRSEAVMIDAVNHLFIQQSEANVSALNPFLEADIPYLSVKAGGVAEKKGRLLAEGAVSGAGLEVIYLEKSDTAFNAESARRASVQATACKILELVNLGQQGRIRFVSDEGAIKPLQPSDITVLVRTHDEALSIQNALQDFGVPGVLQSTGNIFESEEAEHFFYFMAAVAEPGEHSLRPFLLTPFVNKTLAELRDISDDKLQDWHQLMIELQGLWKREGFMSMFSRFMFREKIRERILAMKGGERIITNMLHLAELVHRQSAECRHGMDGLLSWLNKMITEPETRPEHEIYLERDADAVHILTVHASKGLEFNVVFCPFEWNRHYDPWWLKGASSIEYYNRTKERWELDIQKNGDDWVKHKQSVWREELAENLRLLYVAVTRARNKCYLVTGDIRDCQLSALNYLLCGKKFSDVAVYLSAMKPEGNGSTELAKQQLDEMKKGLEVLTASSNGLIYMQKIAEPQQRLSVNGKYVQRPASRMELRPASFAAVIETDWGVGSFSWLVREVSHGHKQAEPVKVHEGAEEDLIATPNTVRAASMTVPILPKGARTGSAVHEIFEEVDFVLQDGLNDIVRAKLRKYGIGNQGDFEKVVSHTAQLVGNTLKTPIPAALNLTLNTVSRQRRLTELEFFYPVRNITPDSVAEVFRTHGKDIISERFASQIGRLTFNLKKGFMGGFVDLIFEHAGRYYVLDWKTNWLGQGGDAYSQAIIKDIMLESYYMLQYHLYTVAVHLYLRKKLPGYRYDEHFGGVIYTFVRGMTPDRPGHSVFFDRPDEMLIRELCQTLGTDVSS